MADRDSLFDWNQGQWFAPASTRPSGDASAASWRMTVTSDWAAIRDYTPILCQQPAAIYGDLLDILRDSDLNITNVEAVLGEVGDPIPKAGPHLRSPIEAAAALSAGHFHVACLANNHLMDYGLAGMQSTIDALTSLGLAFTGAGMNQEEIERPLIQQVKGVKVAIINCGEGESGRSLHGEPGVYGMDAAKVAQQVRDLRSSNQADVIVVIFHGGREFTAVPPPYVVRDLRLIAQAGPDAVIGHHPHVPQGIEIHQGVPIAYSLGNFVFWQTNLNVFKHVGYMVHLDFKGSRLSAFSVTPYHVGEAGLRLLSGDRLQWFNEAMTQASAVLQKDEDIHAAWSAFVASQDHQAMLNNLSTFASQATAGDEASIRFAARLRNLFLTPAHHHFYVELLQQRMTPPTLPDWAVKLVQRWAAE